MKTLQLTLSLLALLWLSSCNEKDLCFDHWDHASRYSVDFRASWVLDWQQPEGNGTDWEQAWGTHDFGMTYNSLRPTRPTGIRSQVYTDGHDNDNSNIPADGGIVDMTPGEHQILFYNNDTEYIVINDITSLASAKATTRSRSRSTYIGNSYVEGDAKENTVNPPDFLFGHYIPEYTAQKSHVPPIVDITMRPLVYRYLVRYRFKYGLGYVALGRGAMAGMAGSVYLNDGHTGDDAVTVLYDCYLTEGGVEAIVNTFGVPDYPNPEYSRASRKYGLNLEVRLTNGRILNFDFDISRQIEAQPRGGVIEVDGIEISDELGKDQSGSFDVDLEGWGEYEDVTIDFGNPKDQG
ncbi:MAG: DUF5119 domain-containing protein [Muribaculaceae bacterium]|nr:DUF5119 domain-containing protein [Muribaculaceae bacterium]